MAHKNSTPSLEESRFDEFWAVYPRKVAKGDARRAWVKAIRVAGADEIIGGASRYAADPNRTAEYTAHPASWLNGERWEDDALPVRTNGKPQTKPDPVRADPNMAPLGCDRCEGGWRDTPKGLVPCQRCNPRAVGASR